jgi:hypothetical protein
MGVRRIGAAVLVVASLIAACGAPPPGRSWTSHAKGAPVRIRYAEPRDAASGGEDPVVAEHREAAARVRRAVVDDLAHAGYEVTADGPYDLAMEITVAVRTRPYEDAEVRDVMIMLRDRSGAIVDRIRFEAMEGAPAKKPERVAVSLVNALVESPKLERYSRAAADERRPRLAKERRAE